MALVLGVVLVSTAAVVAVYSYQGPTVTQASADGPFTNYQQTLNSEGVTQSDLDTVTAKLAGVRVSVSGHEIPTYVIAETAFGYVHAAHQPASAVSTTNLLHAIAVQALQQETYVAAKAAGLAVTDAEINAWATQQEQLFEKQPSATTSGLIPAGMTPAQYFSSSRYRDAYRTSVMEEQERRVIVGNLTGSSAIGALKAWAGPRFAKDVVIVGAASLGGVTGATLVTFL